MRGIPLLQYLKKSPIHLEILYKRFGIDLGILLNTLLTNTT